MNLEALYKITYGLYVISSSDGQHESGFLGNTVMQVTSSPVKIALCASKSNYTTELIQKSKKLTLSALNREADQKLIGTFGFKSGKNMNKFADIKHAYTKDHIPVLTENINAWFEGKVVSEQDLDSHILFIVDIENSEILDTESEPMTYDYYRRVMKGKAPESAPTYINILEKKEEKMEKTAIWVCDVCGYEYDPAIGDPDSGVKPGTAFEDIPDDWVCPVCGVDKSNFSKK